jgi:DNA polymerase III subunit epsilon
MKISQVVQYMKQLSGKVRSPGYLSSVDPENLQQMRFIRQLQKDIKGEQPLDIPLQKLSVVVFDLETTGFFPQHGDEILSIGAVKVRGEEVQDEQRFYTTVQADVQLTPEIKQLTGLSEQDLEAGSALGEAIGQFYRFVGKKPLVAHHAKHEKNFMQNASWQLWKTNFEHRIMDTSFIMNVAEPDNGWTTLEDCCRHCDIEVVNRHHALGDACLTAQLWTHYIKHIREKGYRTLRDVYEHLAVQK